MEINGSDGWIKFDRLMELNGIPELQKRIERIFGFMPPLDAIQYCQGFVDGVKMASYYEPLSGIDWQDLKQYIQEQYYKKMSNQSDTVPI